jgi:quercetin dioxygenase-like cupin family protein
VVTDEDILYDMVSNPEPAIAGPLEVEMKIVNMNEAPKQTADSPIFTGSDVTRQVLVPEGSEFRVHIVNFGKGVRNKFHAHDCDQVLIVTHGTGIVATEDEERVVTVGDVIHIPAGEKHLHGATDESDFSHIFVTKTGSKLTQMED